MPVTNTFGRMPLERIWVNRAERQRGEADPEAGGLLQSVALRGVLMPVILEEEPDSRGYHILYAGERRYAASLQLGLPDIPFRFARAPSEREMQIIEFEENAKRKDLTWQETLQAVVRLHEAFREEDPGHTYEATAEELGWSDKTNVRRYHFIHASWHDEAVRRCATANEAFNLLNRRQERARASKLEDWLGGERERSPAERSKENGDGGMVVRDGDEPGDPCDSSGLGSGGAPGGSGSPPGSDARGAVAPGGAAKGVSAGGDLRSEGRSEVGSGGGGSFALASAPLPVVELSFLDWAPRYTGQRFNLIHCDFPYGIKFGTATHRSGSNSLAREEGEIYADGTDVYDELLSAFVANFDRFASESCHVMFWYSNRHDVEVRTRAALGRIPGFAFLRFPLVWHKSDNAGFLTPGTPRHVYETCLVGGRGERPIVKYVSDAYSSPSDNSLHMSAKPEPMLRYFMGMFCDEHSRLLDPTCGSGSALRAAESLKAERVLGLETNPEMVRVANVALLEARRKRRAAGVVGDGGGK